MYSSRSKMDFFLRLKVLFTSGYISSPWIGLTYTLVVLQYPPRQRILGRNSSVRRLEKVSPWYLKNHIVSDYWWRFHLTGIIVLTACRNPLERLKTATLERETRRRTEYQTDGTTEAAPSATYGWRLCPLVVSGSRFTGCNDLDVQRGQHSIHMITLPNEPVHDLLGFRVSPTQEPYFVMI